MATVESPLPPERKSGSEIFRSLSGDAANALFLPPLAEGVAASEITHIDYPPGLRGSSYAGNHLALRDRLTTDFRFDHTSESQEFHKALSTLVSDRGKSDALRSAYSQLLVRNDTVGPVTPSGNTFLDRALRDHLGWWMDEGRFDSPKDAQRERAGIKKKIDALSGNTTSVLTRPFNSVILQPEQMYRIAGEFLLEEILRGFPEHFVYSTLDHPLYYFFGFLEQDKCLHPNLIGVANETQQRLQDLSQRIASEFPYGQLRDLATNIAITATLPAQEAVEKAKTPVMDLEYLLRATDFWREWQQKGLPICSPTISEDGPVLEIVNGICSSLALSPKDGRPQKIVPQTIKLTTERPTVVLAGSSDSGKTTILRQIAQSVTSGLQGQFITAEGATLSPLADMIAGVRVVREPAQGSSHRQEMHFLRGVFDRVGSGKEPRLVLLDDLLQRTGSKDGEALLRATLKYLQDRNVLTLVATHLNSATKHFADDGLKAGVYSLDLVTHQMKKGVEKSGAIEVAEKAHLEQEIIDIARQLQEQENQQSIHLSLPEITAKERLPETSAFQTDEKTIIDLSLYPSGYGTLLNALYLTRSPFIDHSKTEPTAVNSQLDRMTHLAFGKLFSESITELDRSRRLKTIDVLLSEKGLMKNLYRCLSSLTGEGFSDPLGLNRFILHPEEEGILLFGDFEKLFSVLYRGGKYESFPPLRTLAKSILENGGLGILHNDAQRINVFLDSEFMSGLQKLVNSHPENPKISRGDQLRKKALGERNYRKYWKSQWVKLCYLHEDEVKEFAQSVGNLGAYVTLTSIIKDLPFVETTKTQEQIEKTVENGLNPYLMLSLIQRNIVRIPAYQVLTSAMGKMRYEAEADPWYDFEQKIRSEHKGTPELGDILLEYSKILDAQRGWERAKNDTHLGMNRDEWESRLREAGMVDEEQLEITLSSVGFPPAPKSNLFEILKQEYPILEQLQEEDLAPFLNYDESQDIHDDNLRIAYLKILGKLYPELTNLTLADLPRKLGYAQTPEERMNKFIGFMNDPFLQALKDVVLVDTPEFIDEALAVFFIGPNDGGKTQFLFKHAYEILWDEQIGRILGTKGHRQKNKFLLTALRGGYDTETQGSLHSEFANRIQPLIDRYKTMGEPTGGVIIIDEPISPWTSHEEAKYLIAALVKYFERRGVKVRMTTHCMEAIDLLEKLDQPSRVNFTVASAASPLGDKKYQIKQGKGESQGIDVAEAEKWPHEIIANARRIRNEL